MWQRTKNIYHLVVAILANVVYGFPSRDLVVIGITGTDGKTTTTSLIYHILSKSGVSTALISTVGAVIGGYEYKTGFHVTTPGSFAIQSYLSQAKKSGATHVVLEVTSHALDQNRVWGIEFAVGLITNITHEHLDYHKTYQQYVLAKEKLLRQAKVRLVNMDDKSYEIIAKHFSKDRLKTYGLKGGDYTESNIAGFKTALIGEYNRYNILSATAVSEELGLKRQVILEAVASFRIPKGRGEIVYENDFAVMVDFAHTPNSFYQLLSSLKKMKSNGRLIHVFGSAGERDMKKRPLMGEIASNFDDVMIVTAEDPRSEPVEKITEQIVSGVITVGNIPLVLKVADRQNAIDTAVGMAEKHDIVVITGKGHEESMNLGEKEVEWSDHKAVKKALEKRHEK